MFHSIRSLLNDWQLAAFGEPVDHPTPQDPNIGSLGAINGVQREARSRIIAQLGLTLFVIGLCSWVITRPDASETSIRLAHTGFGIVMGYWFR